MNSGNTLKTVFLMTLLTGILVVMGQLVGGQGGMLLFFGMAMAMNFVSYWFSDKIALRMAGAKEVSYEDAPDLHRTVEQLAIYARMPKPRVYVIESASPNAFATGRDPGHSAVAVTTGIMRILNSDELAGVLAHELAHIRNRDTLLATVVAAVAGAITMIAHMAQWALIFGGGRGDDDGEGVGSLAGSLLMIILAPIAATIIQLAISRAREYDADATGARVMGDPNALANALEKLEVGTRYAPLQANPATSHLFIVNPFAGGLTGLFSTHPPIVERVARLRQMALQPSAYGIAS